jgi:hypothetical protein
MHWRFDILLERSLWLELFMGFKRFNLATFILICENLQLCCSIWIVGTRPLISHMNVPCEKIFLSEPNLWPWPCMVFDILFENFKLKLLYLLNGRHKGLIFLLNIPFDKIFLRVSKVWPFDLDVLTYFLKTLNVTTFFIKGINISHEYSIWQDCCELQIFLTLWPLCLTCNMYLLKTFGLVLLGLWYFTWVILVARPFKGY